MRDLNSIVTGLFYLYWAWRFGSFFYSCYAVADTMTLQDTGAKAKAFVMLLFMLGTTILHSMPLQEHPRLSLASTVLSTPSQFYSIYFLHRYVGRTLNSIRVTILIYIFSLISVMQTVYLIYLDLERMN